MGSPLSAMRLLELSKLTRPGTNFQENPLRYMDHSSIYTGFAPPSGARGETDLDYPERVKLLDTNFGTIGADRTAAHEGTHSKLLIDEKRKKKDKAPSLSKELRGRIYDLLNSNPEFMEDYTGERNVLYELDPDYVNYILDSDEVLARLNAIEATNPKGLMLEKSKYAKDIFDDDNTLIDEYLSHAVPEGYLRENQSKTFRPLEDQRNIRDQVRDWLNKVR